MVTFHNIGKLGRLGNQLFQIAAVAGYSKKFNYNWSINNWSYKDFFENNISYSDNIQKVFYEYYETDYKEIPNLGSNLEIFGYFQSEKYFESHKDYVKYIFKPKKEIIEKIKNNNVCKFNNEECVIHIRRGDYINLGHFLGKKYYENSINEMKNDGVKKFFIVSDDIEWCKENFKSSEFYFSKNNIDIEDLFFMSLFKNIIIANSSFSWWGAYLGENKKTICPDVPFKDWSNFEDYYPKTWKKIKI
jgi:hypothetical protein